MSVKCYANISINFYSPYSTHFSMSVLDAGIQDQHDVDKLTATKGM